jgi:hypothetical protein
VLDEKREVTTYWTDGKLYQRTARRSSLLQQEAKTSEMKEGDVKDFKIAAWSLISMKRMKHYLPDSEGHGVCQAKVSDRD